MNNNSHIELTKVEHLGDIPQNRFGHTLVHITPSKVCLFGGSVGDSHKLNYNNDIFTFNFLTKIWQKIIIKSDIIPKGRAAHAACSCGNGKMAIYGGSIMNGGLAEDILYIFKLNLECENEGEWIEIKVNGETPKQRYGNSLNYLEPYIILFGGNCNPKLENDIWLININKEDNLSWIKIDAGKDIPSERLYHSSCICPEGKYKNNLLIFGGRNSQNKPLNDLWALSLNLEESDQAKIKGTWTQLKAANNNEEFNHRINHTMLFYKHYLIILGGKSANPNPIPIEVFDIEKDIIYKLKKISMNRHTSFLFDNNIYLFGGFSQKNPLPLGDMYIMPLSLIFEYSDLKNILSNANDKIETKNDDKNKDKDKVNYLLSNEVVIGSDKKIVNNSNNKVEEELSSFTKLSLSKLADESKRLGASVFDNQLITKKNVYNRKLIEKFLYTLLRPLDWFDKKVMDELKQNFPFKAEEIISLSDEVIKIISKENSLIKIRSPCKIFGNIYGLYTDLMRYFESFGNPSDNIQNGDINVMQYIFLGDFCDRGNQSLEVILLLFALKVKYPDFIYLIRGHHEDININEFYGLGEECKEKLNEDIKKEESAFNKINQVFDYLPFGVLVDSNILCIHGGIGSSIKMLDDISNISRPTKIIINPENLTQLHILDLLYSEYDEEEKNLYSINESRDKNKKGLFVKYGKIRLDEFCQNNNINLIIASHKFIKEGFSIYNNDKLLNIYSCTNYMDEFKNVGAMIIIGKKAKNKNANIMPKLIGINENKTELYKKNKSPSPVKINKNK